MRQRSVLSSLHPGIGAVTAVAICLSGCGQDTDEEATVALPRNATFTGAAACAECHAEEFTAWAGSHHAYAMRVAKDDTVLGDFDNGELRHFETTSRFFRQDARYRVRTDNAQGELQDFDIKYTFGITPLQQYLVEFPDGRLQVLATSWDARPREAGGQRWFHIYDDQAVRHTDPLHWTGRGQNWNYMCAECHSTGLEKNYRADSDSFDTRWAEINVACEACHGPGSSHVLDPETAFAVELNDTAGALWRMNPVTGIAERSRIRTSPPVQPEACGRCHSRRAAITGDYEYGRPLADTHLPSLLEESLYYADGQIRGEVYVYGSFLQSRMYRAGVSCSDCHDPHSARLKTKGDANDVCAACHLPQIFSATGHHRHETGAVACVDCHMPATTYMVVDPRRDHSFRIPRPALTIKTGAPNACGGCHGERGAIWAANALDSWYGETASAKPHFAEAIYAGRSANARANAKLVGVIDDGGNAGIVRATALRLLTPPLADDASAAIRRALSATDPLMRIGALRALEGIAPAYRAQWAAPLLKDPIRAVRIQAVTVLSPARATLQQSYRDSFRKAEREYITAQSAIAERPEAHINLGNLYAQRGEADRAERSYLRALRMEPRWIGARVNLADLYRQLGRETEAVSVLREGLELDDTSAALHHALGLTLARGDKADAALMELARAAELDASNARYVYVHAVALNSFGDSARAIAMLEDAREQFPADYDIAFALATIYRDSGRTDDARAVAEELLGLYPNDQYSRLLLQSL